MNFKYTTKGPLLQKANPGDAGYDLEFFEEGVAKGNFHTGLHPGERGLFKTGISLAIPEFAVGLIHPRSGLALKKGLTVLNAPGTIDSGYRGEVGVILINHSNTYQPILNGDRIAQIIFQYVEHPKLDLADALDETARGFGGFGSTGVKPLEHNLPA